MPRLLPIVAFAICFMPLSLFAQPAGSYQSSLDGQVYELRPRGDLGLDLYAPDGRVLAVMDRGKPTDDFKGRTEVLAMQCPGNSGKIETRGVEAGRVRMRVEVAQKNVKGEVRCHMFGFVQWRQFDLVKADGAMPASVATPANGAAVGAVGGSVTTATFSNVRFSVVGATAQGKTLTVTITVANQGTDRLVTTHRQGGGTSAAALIDDGGATYGVTLIKIGNQDWYADLISGVATPLVATFEMNTVGGVLQASTIRRLTLPTLIIGDERGAVEFRNVAIQKDAPAMSTAMPTAPVGTATPAAGTFALAAPAPAPAAAASRSGAVAPAAPRAVPAPAPDPAATPSPAAVPAASAPGPQSQELKGVVFQILEATAQNSTLTITLAAINQGTDRLLNTARRGGGVNAAKIIDDQGNTHGVTLITLGNQQWQSDLVNGIRTTVKLTFEGMPTVGGTLQAASIARLTLPGVYIGQEYGALEFRNIAIRKQQ